jgi:hypothetical protein
VIPLAQAATQPCQSAWTPGEVAMLMSVFSSVVIAGIVGGIIKVIEAGKNARLAVLAATQAKATSEHNTNQLNGLQAQVTQVALNAAPPAALSRAPVVPASLTDAQIRAAGEPDPPPPPHATEG